MDNTNKAIDKAIHFKLSLLAIVIIIAIILFAKSFFGSMIAVSPIDNRTTDERIAKVSKVYLEGEIDIAKIAAAPKKSAKARTGKELFTSTCSTCHAAGVLGAPKYGNKTDWAPRAAQGIDALLKSALHGKGNMPPRGTCGDCADSEIKSAIEYMLDAIK